MFHIYFAAFSIIYKIYTYLIKRQWETCEGLKTVDILVEASKMMMIQ